MRGGLRDKGVEIIISIRRCYKFDKCESFFQTRKWQQAWRNLENILIKKSSNLYQPLNKMPTTS